MTKIEELFSKFPVVVQEQVEEELRKAGVVEELRLRVLLPILGESIQVSKPTSGGYVITLIDIRNGKPLIREDNDKKFTIADFVSAFNFESGFADNSPTITWEQSSQPSGDQLEAMADGTLNVLPPFKPKPEQDSIPASKLAHRYKGYPDILDIASGKIPVDMDS